MAFNPNIGCSILAHVATHLDAEANPNDLPGGFSFLGAGSYRTAFLGPDGIVYKVEHHSSEGANSDEANFFTKMSDKPWCPEFHYLEDFGVMAMPKYPHPTYRDFDRTSLRGEENLKRVLEIEELTEDAKHQNLGLNEDRYVVLIDGNFNSDTW